MINTAIVTVACPVCGESLGRNGLCTACLLRLGLEAGDESTVFGDFEIERREDGSLWELGRGAMGVTYRAADKVLKRTVALKVIETPVAPQATPVRERFLREARAAAALRHPNIAGVFQFGASPEGHRCYCAMELVEGETLEALVRRDGPLPADVTLDIAMQATRALIAAAERGLVHRDLKPGNIMLAKGEQALEVKVIDFGLAKAANAAGDMELTHNGFVGTPAFASPEQFAGGAIDARTDIYALGVTMWFALTGRLPFAGTTIEEIRARQAKGVLPNEQLKLRGVPEPLIELMHSCLAFDPVQRPASAGELMRALELSGADIGKTKRSRKVAIAALIPTLVAAVVLAFYLSGPQGKTLTSPLENTNALRTTDNPEAYLLFLRGRKAETTDKFRDAVELYRQAFALDPIFALARARFSICASESAHISSDHRLMEEARIGAEDALRLSPNLAEAHVAIARCHLDGDHDYERALKAVTRAAELAPNSAEVQLNAAFVYKGKQNFRQRIEALRRAEDLDPDNTRMRSFLVVTYRCVRDWRNAIQALDRLTIRATAANLVASRWSRARDEFRLSGNIDALKKAIAEEANGGEASAAQLDFERFQTAMFERDYANAAHYLSQIAPETYAQAERVGIPSHTKAFDEALLAVASESAPSLQEQALQAAEQEILSPNTATSDSGTPKSFEDLALIHALLGRKEEAIREAEKAIEVMEGPPGSIEKNALSSALALVYARTGESEKALDLIEHLLTLPSELQG
ncbi:MAG: protein kinase domain-containing protein, partial [Chthoniobacterales bacterium]